jgi:hypothetical protein
MQVHNTVSTVAHAERRAERRGEVTARKKEGNTNARASNLYAPSYGITVLY